METKENASTTKSPKENFASQHQLSGPKLQYFKSVKEKLDQQWAHAKSATSPYPSGLVIVRIILLPSGEVETITILKSSGLTQLDEEALSVVKGSAPFAAFPIDFEQKPLTLDVSFVYENIQAK